jgi:hypothetical protein
VGRGGEMAILIVGDGVGREGAMAILFVGGGVGSRGVEPKGSIPHPHRPRVNTRSTTRQTQASGT